MTVEASSAWPSRSRVRFPVRWGPAIPRTGIKTFFLYGGWSAPCTRPWTRSANGIEAVHEYTQTKSIWVERTGGTRDPFTLG